MLTALINRLGVHEDENMPTELKLGRLDHLDGPDTRTCCEKEMAA